jgi:DNA adenine methylase
LQCGHADRPRARRPVLYLQRLAFGGKVAGRSFRVDSAGSSRFDITKLGPVLEAIHERLAGVSIECLPWPEFLERYDSPSTLFYLDPPYWGSEDDYGSGVFRRPDFIKLAAHLSSIAGRFVLSVNDVPETRKIFERFLIEQLQTRYTVTGGKWSDVGHRTIARAICGGKRPAVALKCRLGLYSLTCRCPVLGDKTNTLLGHGADTSE